MITQVEPKSINEALDGFKQ